MATELQEDCLGLSVNPTLLNPSTLAPIDLTTASEILFRFLGPTIGATVVEVTGAVDADPTTGKVYYSNTSDEFSTPGNWKYQVKVTFATGQVFYSKISKVKVKANLGTT